MLKRLTLVAVTALAASACSYNSYGTAENRSIEGSGMVASRNVDVPGDADFSGMMVGVDGYVGRDLSVSGATVRAHVDVGRDLSAEGARVRFRGDVGGNADVAAATAELQADIAGRLVIAGARFTIDGSVQGDTEANGARMDFRGDFVGPVHIVGEGDRESGRAILAGRFLGGGRVCATEIEIRRQAEFDGDFLFIAEERPAGLPQSARYERLDGRECDRIRL